MSLSINISVTFCASMSRWWESCERRMWTVSLSTKLVGSMVVCKSNSFKLNYVFCFRCGFGHTGFNCENGEYIDVKVAAYSSRCSFLCFGCGQAACLDLVYCQNSELECHIKEVFAKLLIQNTEFMLHTQYRFVQKYWSCPVIWSFLILTSLL